MRNVLVPAAAGVTALALGFALVGCGQDASNEATTESAVTTSETTSETTTTQRPMGPDGTAATLHDYIIENEIAEFPIEPDDPAAPDVDFGLPPGWSEIVAEDVPDWAYGGIVYDKPSDPANPPTVLAIASKLVGDVDVEQIFRYAPGLLWDLNEFEPLAEPERGTVSGFEYIIAKGTYKHDGKDMVVGEQTIVVPGADDAVFVFQLQATALESERQVVVDAVDWLDNNAEISVP